MDLGTPVPTYFMQRRWCAYLEGPNWINRISQSSRWLELTGLIEIGDGAFYFKSNFHCMENRTTQNVSRFLFLFTWFFVFPTSNFQKQKPAVLPDACDHLWLARYSVGWKSSIKKLKIDVTVARNFKSNSWITNEILPNTQYCIFVVAFCFSKFYLLINLKLLFHCRLDSRV